MFQPYTPPTATNLRDDVVFDGGNYYRTFDPIYTFGYNTALVDADQAPSEWKDLLNERWAHKLGIAQAGAGGSALALTRFQRDVLGDDYLRQYAPTHGFSTLSAPNSMRWRGARSKRARSSSAASTSRPTRTHRSTSWCRRKA